MISSDELTKRQNWSLERKVEESAKRIEQYYEYFEGKVYGSFSGGKDSTVLLDIIRSVFPDVVGVFVDTGLEFPEIKTFVKNTDNIITLKPKMPFHKVIDKYGFPIISKENAQKISEIRTTKSDKLRFKRLFGDEKGNGVLPLKWHCAIDAPFKISDRCCHVMKKQPIKQFERELGLHPIVGTMAQDSSMRSTSYKKTGCNSFESKRPMSLPLSFWKEKDIWDYIKIQNIPYSKIYDMGYDRTGCMFCMFGVHLEKGKNRFQKMKKTHPKHYKYCIEKLGCGKVLDYIGIKY